MPHFLNWVSLIGKEVYSETHLHLALRLGTLDKIVPHLDMAFQFFIGKTPCTLDPSSPQGSRKTQAIVENGTVPNLDREELTAWYYVPGRESTHPSPPYPTSSFVSFKSKKMFISVCLVLNGERG